MFGLEGCVLAAHVRILETYFFIPILLCPQGSGLFFIDVLYRLCYRGFGAMLWVSLFCELGFGVILLKSIMEMGNKAMAPKENTTR